MYGFGSEYLYCAIPTSATRYALLSGFLIMGKPFTSGVAEYEVNRYVRSGVEGSLSDGSLTKHHAFCAVPTHQTLQSFQGKRPTLGPGTFVAPNAAVIGDVKLGKSSSVWYGAVLRGEVFTSVCQPTVAFSKEPNNSHVTLISLH